MTGEVAALLKHKREENGLSPKDAADQASIPEQYLHILEGQGDPRVLADTLYLIPFLRTYSAFLDLDSGQAVSLFLADMQKNPYAESPASPIAGLPSRSILVIVIVLIVLALGAYFLKDSLPWLESLGNQPGSR
jgi:cytoskeletal protein RodZ